MSYSGLSGYGTLPTEDLSIAQGKQYTFKFSSWSSKSTIEENVAGLSDYASDVSVTTSGMTIVEVSLTPSFVMKLSDWKAVFGSMGLADMTDLTLGNWETPNTTNSILTPGANISEYWTPKIQAAENAISGAASSVFSGLKTTGLVVGGIAVVLLFGYAYMHGRGARQTYSSNPRRKKRTVSRR